MQQARVLPTSNQSVPSTPFVHPSALTLSTVAMVDGNDKYAGTPLPTYFNAHVVLQ